MSLAKVIRFPLAPELVAPEFPDFHNLPFIKAKGRRSGGGLDYWSVTTTGSYAEDCLLGDRYAEQFLALTPTNGHFALLGWIVESMIENGPAAKGVRIGFMARVSRYAFAMAKAVRE